MTGCTLPKLVSTLSGPEWHFQQVIQASTRTSMLMPFCLNQYSRTKLVHDLEGSEHVSETVLF